MGQSTTLSSDPSAGAQAEQAAALLSAVDQLLDPLARLCIEKGVAAPAVEERLRQAFVRNARTASESIYPERRKDRLTSRISAMTGLTRREVTRLESAPGPRHNTSRSLVSEVFAHWLADPTYRDEKGRPRAVPRLGRAPSFEALAASVTRDVHARTLLDELARLGLASLDPASDLVSLREEAFVPRGQWTQMLAYLGDNVSDHLRAAVTNVLGTGNEHFEQALFADELSIESLQKARGLISEQWRHLLTTMATALQSMMDEDKAAGRPQDQSLRLGLYSWSQPMLPAHGSAADSEHLS